MSYWQSISQQRSLFLSAGISLALIALLGGDFHIWDLSGPQISARWLSILALLLIAGSFFLAGSQWKTLRPSPNGILPGLLLIFLSDWPARSYNSWLHQLTRGEILLFVLIALLTHRLIKKWSIGLLTFLWMICLASLFLGHLGDVLIFSDDHATFLYRLQLLKSEFPFIPFYSPEWNAGNDARDFFATGALNIFALASPLLYLFKIESVYNLIVCLLLFLIVPLSSFLACKRLGLSTLTAYLSSLLAVSSSLTLYRWTLSYGTLGFVTTAALFPLALSQLVQILANSAPLTLSQALMTIAVISLVVCWTPAGLALLPLLLIGVLFSYKLLRHKYVLTIGLALLLINIPWMLLFWSASNVSGFLKKEHSIAMITQETGHEHVAFDEQTDSQIKKAGALDLKLSLKVLRETTNSSNPLILLLALPGLFLLSKRQSFLLSLSYLWLLCMGALFVPIKPQLELDRMLVILMLASCVPAARALSWIVERADQSSWNRVASAICLGALMGSLLCIGSVVKNRSLIRFSKQGELASQITEAARSNAADGRVLFSGFMLHEFGGGHVAPLPYFSGKPVIAANYVHSSWKYQQVFPKEYISAGLQGILDYLNILNVSIVFAHEREWRDYFRKHSDYFEEIWRFDRFSLFRLKSFNSNFFYSGSGKLLNTTTSSLVISLDTPDAIIKFRHFDFLKSSDCHIAGKQVSESLRLIELSACPLNTPITIRARHPFSRFFIKGES